MKEQTKPAGMGALGGSLSGALGSFASALPGGGNVSGMFGGMMSGGKGATTWLGLLGGAFAGLTAGVVGAGVALVGFGLKLQSVIGQSGRMAQLLGLSFAGMQTIEHQANMAGVPVEELHHNLFKLQEAISDVGSKGHQALAKLGLDMNALRDMNGLDQWRAVDGAMRKIKNSGDLILANKEAMGKGGAAMANMFGPMSKTFKEAAEDADKLGLMLSKADVAKVQEGNKAWKEMQSAIKGLGMSLAVELAPAVKDISSAIKEMVIGIRQFMGEINIETPEWMKVLRSLPSVFMLGMQTIATGLLKLFQGVAEMFSHLPGFGDSKKYADAFGEMASERFEEMEKHFLAIDAIFNPKTRPVVPGKPKFDEEPAKAKSDTDVSTKNKLALAGSVEAFSIINGDQKDKMFRVANQQLAENKKASKALEKIVQKFAGGVKFFKRKL